MANAVTAELATAEAEVICALPFKPAPELGEELLGLATIVLNAVLIGVDVPVEAAGGTAADVADCNAVTAALFPVPEADGIGSTDVVEAGTLFTTLLLLLRTLLLEFEMALDC